MLAFNQFDSKFKGFILSFQRKPVSAAGCYLDFLPCCSRTICPWVTLMPQMASTSPTDRSPFIFWPIALHESRLPFIFFLRLSCHFTALTLHERESLDFQWTGKKSVHGLQCEDLKWLEFCGRDSAEAERRLRLAPCKAGRGHCSSGGVRRGADCRGGVGSERERGMERGEEGS